MIVLSGLLSASNTDILQGTRLQTVKRGVLTFEISADLATATNNYTATIQLPSGDTPLNAVLVPASGTIGMLDDRNKLQVSFAIRQGGGHPVFSVTESGTAVLAYRVTFTPA